MSGICTFASKNVLLLTLITKYFFGLILIISITKIIIYFHFGEKIPKSFSQLTSSLEILSLTTQLSNDEWKQWIAIKHMREDFNFTIFGVLKLERKTALTIGSFILQYVVILIQTNT